MVPLIVFLPINLITNFRVVAGGSCKGTVGASRLRERNSCNGSEVFVTPVEIVKLKIWFKVCFMKGEIGRGQFWVGVLRFWGREFLKSSWLSSTFALNHIIIVVVVVVCCGM